MTEPQRRSRRRHAALASRVLATGLAAGSAVGLIGVLALGDQAAANPAPAVAPTETSTPTGTPPAQAGDATDEMATPPPAPTVTGTPETSPPATTTGAS